LLDALCYASWHIKARVAIAAADGFLTKDAHKEVEKLLSLGRADMRGMTDGTHGDLPRGKCYCIDCAQDSVGFTTERKAGSPAFLLSDNRYYVNSNGCGLGEPTPATSAAISFLEEPSAAVAEK
jgi:hypothetical protein